MKIEGNIIEPTEYLVECPACNSKNMAEPISRVKDDILFNRFSKHWHTLVKCGVCSSLMLVKLSKEIDPFERVMAEVLWPKSIQEMNGAIPETLRLEVGEARTCFKNAAYTATVVMVRRTLEGVCAEHGMKSSPLFKALTEMEKTGLIEGRLLEWAQALRILGNEGAHFTGHRVSREDAEDSLAFAEAILNYMYVFSEQFTEFKKRRQSSTPAKPDVENKSR